MSKTHVHDCACGCGRPLFLVHQKYASTICRNRHHNRAHHRTEADLAGVVTLSEGLLRRMVDEEAVLHPDEKEQLDATIEQAKREIYLRRGGPDRDFQLAMDRGEVSP